MKSFIVRSDERKGFYEKERELQKLFINNELEKNFNDLFKSRFKINPLELSLGKKIHANNETFIHEAELRASANATSNVVAKSYKYDLDCYRFRSFSNELIAFKLINESDDARPYFVEFLGYIIYERQKTQLYLSSILTKCYNKGNLYDYLKNHDYFREDKSRLEVFREDTKRLEEEKKKMFAKKLELSPYIVGSFFGLAKQIAIGK